MCERVSDINAEAILQTSVARTCILHLRNRLKWALIVYLCMLLIAVYIKKAITCATYSCSLSLPAPVYMRYSWLGHVWIPAQTRGRARYIRSPYTDNFVPHFHQVRHFVYECKICRAQCQINMCPQLLKVRHLLVSPVLINCVQRQQIVHVSIPVLVFISVLIL